MHTGGEAGRSWATAGILDLAILFRALALLLALSAGAIAVFMFSLLLSLMKRSVTLQP